MGWSLGRAAKEAGRSKSTLHRALKDGTLSGAKDDQGRWQIEPAELFRVFQWNASGTVLWDDTERPVERVEQAAERPDQEREAVLTVRVEMLTDALDRERELNTELKDELRGVRDELRAAQERIVGLLAPPVRTERLGWIARLTGRMRAA